MRIIDRPRGSHASMKNNLAISDVQIIEFPQFDYECSSLSVYQTGVMSSHVPFDIARAFVITSTGRVIRGEHAHRKCTQLLIALSGRCILTFDDSKDTSNFDLARQRTGVLVPPSIWLELEFQEEPAAVLVLCDRPYEEEDYIRDYDAFLSYRAGRSEP